MTHKILSTKLILAAIFFSMVTFSIAFAAGNKTKDSEKDIVSIAVESGSFNTLVKALNETGLVEALQGDGPFTVFAPTDEAFAKLPEGTIESLLADKETLKSILLYHVVSGNYSSKEVANIDEAKTLAGKDVMITINNGSVMINNSKVTTADIKASNGVIHIIDTVLIPE